MVDKTKRWDNVDLKAAAFFEGRPETDKILLGTRMVSENSLSVPAYRPLYPGTSRVHEMRANWRT